MRINMRRPEFLSPSALKTFEANKDEYYLKYLADAKPPKLGQTAPMAVGSSFDAYTKSYLHHCLYGNYGEGDAYKFETIFEKQVEPHGRALALVDGKVVFDAYKRSGALADLMLELQTSINKPRFEFEIKGFVQTKIGTVPMLGRPDIFFINGEGARVIPDWKVNGFYSGSDTSPKKGYVKIRDAWDSKVDKPSRGNHMPYKDSYPTKYKGILCNTVMNFEEVDTDWADQITIYGWLLGEEVGSTNLIAGIEQIVGRPPKLRIASHRAVTSAVYQYNLLDRVERAWRCITSGHFFEELTLEESQQRCQDIEDQAKALAGGDDFAQFVNETTRQR